MVRQRSNCHNLLVIYFKGQSRTELNGNILKQVPKYFKCKIAPIILKNKYLHVD